MGFLDNSNANIIVDAVLTDLGRQLLSANNNSFSIRRFSLADDEVDYGTITKFGLSVGKEKIEKNTPVFEAQTNSALALKYSCLSLNLVALTDYPTLTLRADGGAIVGTASGAGSTTGFTVNLNASSSTGLAATAFSIVQTPPASTGTINSSLVEDLYYVKVNRRFLTVSAGSPESLPNGVDVYEIIPSTGSSTAAVTISTILTNTSSDFTTFGDGTTIITPVQIVGARTGITTDLTVLISNA
jgi:hypothetical protein